MATGTLQLLGPYDPWHGAAHLGRFSTGVGHLEQVLVLLGPESTSTDAERRAQQAARPALALRHDGVLSLRAVQQFGERVAWVYEDHAALGLGHTVGSELDALISARAAAEVVARVAEVLLQLSAIGQDHPGPEAADLLVDGAGRLKVAGFAGPFPRSPAMRAPQGDQGEGALVYRLGVLLAQLVSGATPATPTDRAAHASLIRRALIRSMSRPGPVLTERYGDWLRGMLAWEPRERPPLSAVPNGLRTVSDATSGPSLAQWCTDHVEALCERVTQEAEERRRQGDEGTLLTRLPTEEREPEGARPDLAAAVAIPMSPTPPPGPRLTPYIAPDGELPEDDPTQEAADEPELVDSKPPIRVTSLNPIPVQVGPPPEAVRTRPSLPAGFLQDTSHPSEASGAVGPLGTLYTPQTLWKLGFGLGVVALVLLGINAVLWVRSGPDTEVPGPEPSIGTVLGEASGDPDAEVASAPFPVAFVGPEGAWLDVRCGGRTVRGMGQVRLPEATVGRCSVSSTLDGRDLLAEVLLDGPATYECFDGGRSRCR